MQFERTIELRPHVGRKETGELVRLAQDEIYLNGKRVGYVGHLAGSPVNIIAPGVATDAPTLAAIEQHIAQARGGARPSKVAAVPELTDEQELDLAEAIDTRRRE